MKFMPELNRDATAFFKLGGESGQERGLKRALSGLDGILEVEVNFILDTVSIGYDSERVTREQIKQEVDQSIHQG